MATILESNLLAKKHLLFYHGQLLSIVPTRRSSEKYLAKKDERSGATLVPYRLIPYIFLAI